MMTNIIDLHTKKPLFTYDPDLDLTAEEFFGSIIYKSDLIEMIDTILEEQTKRLEQIAKDHGDISQKDLDNMTAIYDFVGRIYEELPKDKYAA